MRCRIAARAASFGTRWRRRACRREPGASPRLARGTMTVRLVLSLAVALGLGGAPAALAQAPNAPPPAVTVAKPIVKQVVEQDDYTGRFDAVETVEVRARVSGYLDQVAFKDGAVLRKGDLLYVIDKRPYQAAVDQADATALSAQARVAFAQGDLERALAASSFPTRPSPPTRTGASSGSWQETTRSPRTSCASGRASTATA